MTINNVANNNDCIDSITTTGNINVNTNALENAADELCLDDFLNEIAYNTTDDVNVKLSKSNEFIPQQANNSTNSNHTYEHNNNNNNNSTYSDILINTTNIFNANATDNHTNNLSMNLNYSHHLETINEESIKELLYGRVSWKQVKILILLSAQFNKFIHQYYKVCQLEHKSVYFFREISRNELF